MWYFFAMSDDPFRPFREGIIGIDERIHTPYGDMPLVYADWTASGRNYRPIEERIQRDIMPLVANTHSQTSTTGTAMTVAYHEAQHVIKKHVHAGPDDLIITAESGMTGLINKFQRILGFKDRLAPGDERPVVFLTHMEHHSNHTSWLETNLDVEVIEPGQEGLVDLDHLRQLLEKYRNRRVKVASVTACSNVTGIAAPYREIAAMMHRAGGVCFVDFACSAPYVPIDIHPADPEQHLDAIFFSPHKFLGGPGSSGVLLFNRKLYTRAIPDNPGGGTVDWTNPWGGHKYVDDIEAREDGGTPAFLQTIRAAMCITLKEQMGMDRMMAREHEMRDRLWDLLSDIPNLVLLAPQHRDRLAILSFYIPNLHYSLGVRLLNDRFGIQCRGGCSCAGTYGHFLLNVDPEQSKLITDHIDAGDFSIKPGWIRISLHPTMTDQEVDYIGASIRKLAENFPEWIRDYAFDPSTTRLEGNHGELDAEVREHVVRALIEPF